MGAYRSRRDPVGNVARFALLACLAAAMTGPSAGAAVPRIEVDPAEVDLGALRRGEIGTALFQVRNAGDATLEILGVDAGCACTVASFDAEIPPGAAGRLEATLDTAELQPGEQARHVTVYSNDPATPEVRLAVRATVQVSAQVYPGEQVVIGNARGYEPSVTLLVARDPAEPTALALADVRSNDPAILVSAERLDARRTFQGAVPPGAPGDWALAIEIAPGTEPGTRFAEVRFATGIPQQPEMAIAVKALVQPPVNLTRDSLELGLPAPGGQSSATLQAIVRRGLDPSLLAVDSDLTGVRLDLQQTGPRSYRLDVYLDADTAPEPGEYAIWFRVGPEAVRLPLRVRPS